MITPVRTSRCASKTSATGRHRGIAALVSLLATFAVLPIVLSAPAVAGPVDVGWAAAQPTGGGTATTVEDGTNAAAQMTYNSDGSTSASWTFTTTATAASAASPIKVPYTWEGLHAWFQVRTRLDVIVNGAVVQTLEQHGPENCCQTPSNGFIYGGVATFNVTAGQTYGFRLSGSNGDYNRFLHGTFTLSTKPFLDSQIGKDNRDWLGAEEIVSPAVIADGTIKEADEARWFKFKVQPGEDVSVNLSGIDAAGATNISDLPADYDLALYGDIGAAFSQLTNGSSVEQLASTSASGVGDTQVPQYPIETSKIPTTAGQVSSQFAPRVYASRVYAPRVYAPRVYAPRVYAPRVYAPRVYAPNSFISENVTNDSFSNAFSSAQNQTLVAASANTAAGDETVSASTGNAKPGSYFYLKVEGHNERAFDAIVPFRITKNNAVNGACSGLHTYDRDYPVPVSPQSQTVIVTDSSRLFFRDPATAPSGSATPGTYSTSLATLASRTGGVVVDVAGSPQIQNLWLQVGSHQGCTYAVNLVADAIKNIVDSYRNATSKYVVIAGGDEVVPFFRYPDTSGLGQESQFKPPVRDTSPSGASLLEDQVQSQDAYGSNKTVTIGGATLPLPDLAVGRLVKTPEEIRSTIQNFVDLGTGGNLPAPTSSLVTGYDFLTDAADAVATQFRDGMAAAPTTVTDELITHPGQTPWNGTQLGDALLGKRHDLVYLAGHFSANDTLAADFSTLFDADELDPTWSRPTTANPAATNADKLRNTLVLSAGCHSGYNIVDAAATGATNPFDWTQRMAQQHAILIGGTGYQYGDSDFLEYSERLYLDVVSRLHEPTSGPIAIGTALALAKQDYLASLATVSGIDQKAMLEATLYGLPMTGYNAPRRKALTTTSTPISTTPVATGTPGASFGLQTAALPVVTDNEIFSKKAVTKPATETSPAQTVDLTWLDGADGVSIQPGVPALPKQIKDVTATGQVLRGVGFRSGVYTDSSGVLPLTGAPAIEGSTPNSTFETDTFFPQRLATANYFGALGKSGRTSLILNPAQYSSDRVTDPLALPTNTVRNYLHLGMQLFYSPEATVRSGQTPPSQAAAPAITAVTGTYDTQGKVTFTAQVTGDPTAGVQQVWVTWTGSGSDSGHGHWEPVDLVQDANDSTLWTGTMTLPQGQSTAGFRFLVQAVNGQGAVSLDTGSGNGHSLGVAGVVDTSEVALQTGTRTTGSPLGVSALVTDAVGPVKNRDVSFTVFSGSDAVFEYTAKTDDDGRVVLALPPGQAVPWGSVRVVAFIFDASGEVFDFGSTTLEVNTGQLSVGTEPVSTASPLGVRATVTDLTTGRRVLNGSVVFTVTRGTMLYSLPVLTGPDGTVEAPVPADKTTAPAGLITVRADLVDSAQPPQVISTGSLQRTAALWTITPGPTPPGYLSAAPGAAYPLTTPLTATVGDSWGQAEGVEVTFTFPASGPSATFPPTTGSTRVLARSAITNSTGLATAPRATAGLVPGSFQATITAPGATSARSIPLGVKYAFGKFVSPVTNPTSTGPTGTTPVKISALLPGGVKISDAEAAAIVAERRFQVRWRFVTPTQPVGSAQPPWIAARTGLTLYDPVKDFFQSDLKASTLGWRPGFSYVVQVRILPPAFDGFSQDPLLGTFDLGTAEFTLKVTTK